MEIWSIVRRFVYVTITYTAVDIQMRDSAKARTPESRRKFVPVVLIKTRCSPNVQRCLRRNGGEPKPGDSTSTKLHEHRRYKCVKIAICIWKKHSFRCVSKVLNLHKKNTHTYIYIVYTRVFLLVWIHVKTLRFNIYLVSPYLCIQTVLNVVNRLNMIE